jgi:signal recognition particle receptor subunit beta
MGAVYKILVVGPFSAGKTEFVRAASDIPIVTTEEPISNHLRSVKDETTVAMDYGQARVGKTLLHLYGTPGQPRFDFMLDILGQGVDAAIMLVDSADRRSFSEARRLLRFLQRKGRLPLLVVASKQDQPGSISAGATGEALRLPDDIPVASCAITDKSSIQGALRQLTALLD